MIMTSIKNLIINNNYKKKNKKVLGFYKMYNKE